MKETLDRVGSLLSDGSRERRRALIERRFTIVSNDCWGAEVYKDFGLPYATPLIGTYLMGPCYMALVADPVRLLRSPLRFAQSSRYPEVNEARARRPHPVGLLEDVEIQFLHYASAAEAAAKWSRRLERSFLDRLFFKLSGDKDRFSAVDLAAFDRMPIRKIAFSAKSYPALASVITIDEYDVDGKAMYPISLRHFDIVDWLNENVRAAPSMSEPLPSR